MKNKLYIVLLACSVIAVGYFYRSVKTDDAFIYYSYAKNIVGGNGWVFNTGERINACTSILYPILLSVLSIGNVEWIPTIGHIIGAVSLFALCLFLFLSSTGAQRYFVPILVLANPLILNGWGMETFLIFAYMAGALYWYGRAMRRMVAIFVLLAILARPDAILFAVVLYGYDWFKNRRLPGLAEVTIIGAPLAAWAVWSYSYFGSPLPSTLGAKLCQAHSESFGVGLRFLSGFNDIPFYGNLIERNIVWMAFFLSVLVVIINLNKIKLNACISILLIWSVIHTMVYGFVLNAINFPWYYTYAIITIAIVIGLALSMVRLLEIKVVTFIILVAIVFVNNEYIGRHNDRWWKHRCYRAIANELKSNSSGNKRSIACSEIGFLKWYYRGPIIDMMGLVTPGQAEGLAGTYPTYYMRYHPHYLVLNAPRKNITEKINCQEYGYKKNGEISLNNRTIEVYELR